MGVTNMEISPLTTACLFGCFPAVATEVREETHEKRQEDGHENSS